jgi:ribonuclease P protein component
MGDLFLSGQSFLCYPLRIVWKTYNELPTESAAQVGFSVPKRSFKHAVDRNQLKRRMRESYRHHKHQLYGSLQQSDSRMALMMIYIAKEELPYSKIEPAIVKALHKIMGQFNGLSTVKE